MLSLLFRIFLALSMKYLPRNDIIWQGNLSDEKGRGFKVESQVLFGFRCVVRFEKFCGRYDRYALRALRCCPMSTECFSFYLLVVSKL